MITVSLRLEAKVPSQLILPVKKEVILSKLTQVTRFMLTVEETSVTREEFLVLNVAMKVIQQVIKKLCKIQQVIK